MKKIFFLVSFFSVAGNIVAQTCTAPVEVLVTSLKNKPMPGDKIIFTGQRSHKSLSGVTNMNGVFVIQLPCGETYDIRIAAIGEEMNYNTLEIPVLKAGEVFSDMRLHITYDLPRETILGDLQFETGSAGIKPSSFASLDIVADFLKRKPYVIMEIAGHTDSDGDAGANLTLSQARANAVRDYLLSKGANEKQLKATGYGESRPVADNSTASGKQQNRRTEIRILSE